MKRIFSFLIVAVFAMAMTASSAVAASTLYDGVDLDGVGATAGTDLVAEDYAMELVDNDAGQSQVILCDGAAEWGGIAFKLGDNLPINTELTLTLTNATFDDLQNAGDNFYLVTYTDTADAAIADGELVSGVPESGGVFGSNVVFTLTSAVPKDTVVAMIADDNGNLADGPPYGNYALLCSSSINATPGDVTVALAAAGYSAADAGAAAFQSYKRQLVLAPIEQTTTVLGEVGVDTIDVDANRLKFDGDVLLADDSGFCISADTGGPPAWTTTVVAADIDDMEIVITGNFSGIEDPETDVDLGANPGNWDLAYTSGVLTATTDVAAAITEALGFAAGTRVFMTVDGVTALATRQFLMTGSVDMADALDVNNVTLEADVVLGRWNINGYQAKLPYIYASDSTYDTFIKFHNGSGNDANVFADITSDDGAETAENVSLGTIPAGQVGIFWANDIVTTAGVPTNAAYSSVYTLTVAPEDITAIAVQKRSDFDRVIPVYSGDDAWKQ